eukprot:462616-Prorocentrum_minimum.AAC.1
MCICTGSPLYADRLYARVRASAENIQLLTFDADGTLYEDGHHFEQNNKMIKLINSCPTIVELLGKFDMLDPKSIACTGRHTMGRCATHGLLRCNTHVAIVTAAGYPGEPERFEQRLAGLLQAFKDTQLPPELCDRFFVMVRALGV